MTPRWPQDGPKTAAAGRAGYRPLRAPFLHGVLGDADSEPDSVDDSDDPKLAPDSPKMAFKIIKFWFLDCALASSILKMSQDGHKMAQHGPKMAHDGLSWPQED